MLDTSTGRAKLLHKLYFAFDLDADSCARDHDHAVVAGKAQGEHDSRFDVLAGRFDHVRVVFYTALRYAFTDVGRERSDGFLDLATIEDQSAVLCLADPHIEARHADALIDERWSQTNHYRAVLGRD